MTALKTSVEEARVMDQQATSQKHSLDLEVATLDAEKQRLLTRMCCCRSCDVPLHMAIVCGIPVSSLCYPWSI